MRQVKNIQDVIGKGEYLECYTSTDPTEAAYLLGEVKMDFVYFTIPLDDMVKMKNDIGFVPMTKFRVYTNGKSNIVPDLNLILKTLKLEHQNIAFVNDMQTRYFADISRRM